MARAAITAAEVLTEVSFPIEHATIVSLCMRRPMTGSMYALSFEDVFPMTGWWMYSVSGPFVGLVCITRDDAPADDGRGMSSDDGMLPGFHAGSKMAVQRSSQWVQGPARGIVAAPLRPEGSRGQTCA